ncbi:38252_t:CDS:1, partial [Gigaspora margarita]
VDDLNGYCGSSHREISKVEPLGYKTPVFQIWTTPHRKKININLLRQSSTYEPF